ncbi:hypothetical protein GIB67_016643 [Kingdonia uniflora]|uniref:MGS-like domain-containing protein n=1 Tax=Kingdonia uniflora TaxID=39325 RepID=A0A7J7MZC8_9MAGN|nr:hypothetical protein GIB67_016643 [Kingdonia uniflora]
MNSQRLDDCGGHKERYTIVSTGGTTSALEEVGISVSKVEQLTGFPEMLDGRVKTLHPTIHGGILARRDKNDHIEALNKHGIGSIDIVVVNLYPFYDKVSSTSGIAFEDGVENIDIGGPAMIRAAAKNHKDVLVVVDSQDYPALLDFLKGCEDDQNFRRQLAWKAFQHVASYDSAVSEWMWKHTVGDKFPPSLTVPLSLKSSLRYGENPHQNAAFYVDRSLTEVNAGGIATAKQHHGKILPCIPVLGVVEQVWEEEDCDYANEMLQWENEGEKDVRLAISANRQEQEKEIDKEKDNNDDKEISEKIDNLASSLSGYSNFGDVLCETSIEWPASVPSEKVPIPPTAAEIYAKIVEKTRVFQFLAGLNPDFEYARVHLLDRTSFPTLEEAQAYCLSDQSRRSPMPPISGIPSETSAMAICYAYPAPLPVPSQISHTSSPSLSPLPTASGRQPPTPDCQASSVASGMPPAIDLPLSVLQWSANEDHAMNWVEDYVQLFLPETYTGGITVGNEVLGASDQELAEALHVASRDDILEAYRLAVKGDPVSAFSGIVAFNTEVDEALAKEIREFRSPTDGQTRMFYEIVVAPKYSQKGLEILRGKSKTLRILEANKNNKGKLSLEQVSGGWLAQDSDDLIPQDIKFNLVSEKTPKENELHDVEFAWLCVKHVKSNAIVIAKNNCMLGMRSGQPNRVESLRLALKKAGEEAKGAALASDAFFPFAWQDAVEEVCQSGIGVIAEPGGSMRDGDAIECCNKYGVSSLHQCEALQALIM